MADTALELKERKEVLVFGGVRLRKGELSVGIGSGEETVSVGNGSIEETIMCYGIVDNED